MTEELTPEERVNRAAVEHPEMYFYVFEDGWRYCDRFGTLYNVVKSGVSEYPVYFEVISEGNSEKV